MASGRQIPLHTSVQNRWTEMGEVPYCRFNDAKASPGGHLIAGRSVGPVSSITTSAPTKRLNVPSHASGLSCMNFISSTMSSTLALKCAFGYLCTLAYARLYASHSSCHLITACTILPLTNRPVHYFWFAGCITTGGRVIQGGFTDCMGSLATCTRSSQKTSSTFRTAWHGTKESG